MRKLIKFNDYLLNKIFEDMDLKIKELELVLSPKLIKILKEMDHVISDTLLEKHIDNNPDYKITFVDLGTDPDKVSFIQSNKVPDLIDYDIVHGDYERKIDGDKWTGGEFDYIPNYKNPWIKDIDHVIDLHDPQFKTKEHPVWNKFRAEMKIGRFINKIFPNKFPANAKRKELSLKDKPNDVESFVNMYISTVESHSKILKMVEGDDILRFYNGENTFKVTGTLGNSCMNDPDKNEFMQMYSKNPDKVKMLVLFPENVRDKIIGRALIWDLDSPNGRVFMDRAYTSNDSDEYMFIEYAKRNNWLYKSIQTFGHHVTITDGKTNDTKKMTLDVYLKNNNFDVYPYLDTFQFYNQDNGHLTNNRDNIEDGDDYYEMVDPNGGRELLD